jgi:hypothetical protein
MVRHVRIVPVIAALLLAVPSSPRAVSIPNAAMEWNQIALAATVSAGQGPLPQARSMTLVQVAVHDAVNSITAKHGTYGAYGPAPAGASPEAAAIAAAHTMLMSLFPSQSGTFNPARAASLAAHGVNELDPGVGVGDGIAAALFGSRVNDGASLAQFPYVAAGSGTPGVWVTIGGAAALLPGWGNVATWVIHTGSQFRPDAPPALDSGRWARDYNEVKVIGKSDSTTRTATQTEIGRFWLGTPSAIWNSAARGIIDARGLDISDTARTFALMYLAAADAGIACWDAKYVYNFWRPQLAIRNGHLDGNDKTDADPTWTPLFPTPPHPEYISGHSTNSSAMGSMLAFLFGNNPGVTIIATSPTNPGFPRQWTEFSEGIDEVIEARIYSGIHYRTSDEVGARVGRQVARFVLTHALR